MQPIKWLAGYMHELEHPGTVGRAGAQYLGCDSHTGVDGDDRLEVEIEIHGRYTKRFPVRQHVSYFEVKLLDV